MLTLLHNTCKVKWQLRRFMIDMISQTHQTLINNQHAQAHVVHVYVVLTREKEEHP